MYKIKKLSNVSSNRDYVSLFSSYSHERVFPLQPRQREFTARNIAIFCDIVAFFSVKSLGTELIDPAAEVVGNASRFRDNHRSSSHRLALLHVALSAVSRLFAAPTDTYRSNFNCWVLIVARY